LCGIYFGSKQKAFEIYELQEERGTDSLGVATSKGTRKIADPGFRFREDVYKDFLKNTKAKKEENIIMHHRKATVGKASKENAHPFVGKRFTIFQNGTNKSVISLAKFFNYEDRETDTETMLTIIEQKAKDLEGAVEILDGFARMGVVGIVFLVDNKTKKILLYSDTARCLYIVKKENKIVSITNFGPKKEDYYFGLGYLIFDFNGEVMVDNMTIYYDEEEKKTFKERKKKKNDPNTQLPAYTGHYKKNQFNLNGDSYYDYYWRTDNWIDEDIRPKKNTAIKEAIQPYFNRERKRLKGFCESIRRERVLEILGNSCPHCKGINYLEKSKIYGYHCRSCYEPLYKALVQKIKTISY
jgi:hypothetical protein